MITALEARDYDFALINTLDRSVLVAFLAGDHALCRTARRELERLDERVGEQLRIAVVDARAEAALAARLGITEVPTIILYAPRIGEIGRLVGLRSAEELLDELRVAAAA